MITGRKIHQAFNKVTVNCFNTLIWEKLSPDNKKTYTQMAFYLNEIEGLPQPCPFCAFYEREPEPIGLVGSGVIGDKPACDVCVQANTHADITELLLEWLEEQNG